MKKKDLTPNLKKARIFSYAYLFVLVFVVLLLMLTQSISYIDIVKKYPLLTVGFINSLINLIIFNAIEPLINEYINHKKNRGYDKSKTYLLMYAAFATFNILSGMYLIKALNHEYKDLSVAQGFESVKNKKLTKKLYLSMWPIVALLIIDLIFIVVVAVNS